MPDHPSLFFVGFPSLSVGVRNSDIFFFGLLAHAEVWLLFNGVLALLFSLFIIICELTGSYPKDELTFQKSVKNQQSSKMGNYKCLTDSNNYSDFK